MFKAIFEWFKKTWEKDGPLCRIEEVDTTKNIVIIHCRGIEAPIKLHFDELIHDIVILSNLSSQHASWVGYYYGKNYGALKNIQNPNSFDFSFKDSNKRCKIIMQDRHGNLVYTDEVTKLTHTVSAYIILTQPFLIAQFDSVQACYIGMVAGIHSQKQTIKTARPLLKLV